ncbi:cobalt ECF transporter T component CbiQ [Methanosphaera sp. ISO3-F5]|uniref:cobalt ECF transporter T component CbiQ n=1 Tax=Methanosphaera sp. ISO3-F5 TaxID=1452353 RepID=UPI002B263D89|nr:cobalt ECF transporter T component CbiQ [Methanosphaera sp. ISO3-F5]WQH63293.1 cobalt ECF transporter T component CbiQ [Methanosphaera sp. ISO3-F5]
MVSINELRQQEYLSNQNSILHNIDSRIKLIVLIITILFAVTSSNYIVFIILEIYLISLIAISRISIKDALIRVLLILPFGLFIAIFQPFVHPGQVLYTLPLGINITLEGIEFAELLMARLTISVTSIVLFSYITPMKDIAEAFRRLHVPNEFAMIFSLFVRFIFLFYDELNSIRQAQASRCFALSNNTPYMWKVKQIGYLFLMMFLRAYERGETVYASMASRGYNSESTIYYSKEKLSTNSKLYLIIPIILIIILITLQYLRII